MTRVDFEQAIVGYKAIGARVIMKNGTTGKIIRLSRGPRGPMACVCGDDGRVWKASPGAIEWEFAE